MDEQHQSHWLTWVMTLVGIVLLGGIGLTLWPYLPWFNDVPSPPRTPPPTPQVTRPLPAPAKPKAQPPRSAQKIPVAPQPKETPRKPVPVKITKKRHPIPAHPKKKALNRRFGTIAYPAARVLDEPDLGDMIGRIEPGKRVEILDERRMSESMVDAVWYRIDFHGTPGWISRLSLTAPPTVVAVDRPNRRVKPKTNPLDSVSSGLVNDYRGKILRVDFLDEDECRVQVEKSMSVEDARETSENIGYYLMNATGKTPRVIVLIERLQIAVATNDGDHYSGVIDIRERTVP